MDAASGPAYLLVEPSHYEVSYTINPWMQPGIWAEDPAGHRREAQAAFASLTASLRDAGGTVEIADGVTRLPDMVFPANGGIVLDGRALLARFRYPQRQGEEAAFRAVFDGLKARGRLDEVIILPDGLTQEGAGDCIWDRTRRLAWTGFGPRSSPAAPAFIAETFDIEVRRLELATERFYHLDTCFCVLPGGEVLFYPQAFSKEGNALIRDTVQADLLIEASDEDAARFCVNAVAVGHTIVMATPADRLTRVLRERGYAVSPVPLEPFILSGGGAYCMTLRLDLRTH
ncbi:dimethylarginine dimethylaminohydrolase family protein [Lichenicoccus sp.]|uniref:dimethylarginine dimethylaminohydrolase family protein n=1 Tax=Lichenicoccus sp. TaxID=2781899 RepID=UPI003D1419E1